MSSYLHAFLYESSNYTVERTSSRRGRNNVVYLLLIHQQRYLTIHNWKTASMKTICLSEDPNKIAYNFIKLNEWPNKFIDDASQKVIPNKLTLKRIFRCWSGTICQCCITESHYSACIIYNDLIIQFLYMKFSVATETSSGHS